MDLLEEDRLLGEGMTAVVANDHSNLLQSASSCLRDRFGLNVIAVDRLDKVEAALKNKDNNISLLVLDNSIPRFQGDELPADQEKNHGWEFACFHNLPVILTTGGRLPPPGNGMDCLMNSMIHGSKSNGLNPFTTAVRCHLKHIKKVEVSDQDQRIMSEYYENLEKNVKKGWRELVTSGEELSTDQFLSHPRDERPYLDWLRIQSGLTPIKPRIR